VIERMMRPVGNWLRGHPRPAAWALKILPDFPITITMPGIGPFRIRLRRNRSFWLRDPLTHEGFPLAALRKLIRAGDVVYDVGANIGLYSRLCITRFHAGRVVAFEPMTDNLKQLRENISLGRMSENVTILPYALSDSDAVHELQIDDISSASAVLATISGGRPSEARMRYHFPPKSEPVACRRLDSLLVEKIIPPPDVMKVDIEGAEDLFLAGAADCLAHSSPKLVIELHGADKARAVYSRLSGHGYHCAGKVSPKLAPSGYSHIDKVMMEKVIDQYDIHFLIATKNLTDLPEFLDDSQP
jgi:FkbM family methyltransferase